MVAHGCVDVAMTVPAVSSWVQECFISLLTNEAAIRTRRDRRKQLKNTDIGQGVLWLVCRACVWLSRVDVVVLSAAVSLDAVVHTERAFDFLRADFPKPRWVYLRRVLGQDVFVSIATTSPLELRCTC